MVAVLTICDSADAGTVGEYTLGRTLGVGSFGAVRLGVNRNTADKVAIKTFSRMSLDSAAIKRLSCEIAAMERSIAGCPFIGLPRRHCFGLRILPLTPFCVYRTQFSWSKSFLVSGAFTS